MQLKKSLLAAGGVAALGTVALVGIHTTQAAAPAERWETMVEQRQENLQARLAQAVTDGTVTQAQADQITAKLQEIRDYRAALKDKSPAERRTAMAAKLKEVHQWAQDNNIPLKFFHAIRHGKGMHRGPIMRFMMKNHK